MKKVFNREESPEPEVTLGNSGGFLKHAKSLQNEDVGVVSTAGPIEEKKKRGRPRKKKLDNANDFLEVEKSDRELSMAESNKPYLDTYLLYIVYGSLFPVESVIYILSPLLIFLLSEKNTPLLL